jgi:hypothetical protein
MPSIAPPMRIPQRPPDLTRGSVGGAPVRLGSVPQGDSRELGLVPKQWLDEPDGSPYHPERAFDRIVG